VSYKKTIGLGLLLTFALLACAAEEQTNATPEASVQETSDGGQDVVNTDQSSSTASATTAPAEKQPTVTTEQPKNDQNSDQSQPLTLLATAFVDVADYWGVQPFATRTNQLGVQFHNGIDYFTGQEKVAIQAVSDGRVMFVDVYERQPDGAFQINLAWQAPSGEIISYSLEPSAGPADAAKIAEQKVLAQKMMESMTIQVGDQIVQGQFLGYLYGQDDWAHVHMSVKASDRGPEQWLCPADYMPAVGESDLLAKSLIWAERLYKGSKQPQLCNY
jgi:murein DD-endopeptidase MepM/ murein hydrolase activator NlpD|tara:strand:- start:215 stop:1036 length:822 start_codon:yes stop_codon:yes gene_type:complete